MKEKRTEEKKIKDPIYYAIVSVERICTFYWFSWNCKEYFIVTKSIQTRNHFSTLKVAKRAENHTHKFASGCRHGVGTR